MTRRYLASAATALLLLAGGSANATLIFGTSSSASTGDIYGGGGITNGAFAFHGGEGFAYSSAIVNDAVDKDSDGSGPWNRGVAGGVAKLFQGHVPPEIRAESILTGHVSDIVYSGGLPVGASAFANGGALEPYRYIGTSEETLSLTYTLTVDVFADPADVRGRTGIFAEFGVWNDQVGFFATDSGSIGESGASPLTHNGKDATGGMSIIGSTGGIVTKSVTVRFDLTPGQVFYVNARVSTGAFYGVSFADAFHTFHGEFDEPDLVRSLVPAPGCAGLLGLGFLATRRRRG